MKRILSIGTTTIALLASTSAWADNFLLYGEVDGWKVYVDQEKKSCLIEAVDGAENVVQMGLTKDRGVAYVGVFTKAETDIKKGDTEAVGIMLGDKLFVGEATGMRGNITKGYSGGYVLTDDPDFVDAVANEKVMAVFPKKSFGFNVDLTGTKKAIEMARECNAKQTQ